MRSIYELISLKDRCALITGATGSLGVTISETLAELGAELILVDRPNTDFSELRSSLREKFDTTIKTYHCDLESHEDRLTLLSKVKKDYKALNILINNAAFVGTSELTGWLGPLEEQSIETWRRAMEVNLTAPFHLCQGLSSLLRESQSANIINIGSIYGLYGPDWKLYEGTKMGNPAAYSTSKAGLFQLTRWLSTTLAPHVRVNAVAPGGILRGQDNSFINRYEKKTPMGRMATEDDFQGVITFLASDMSSYMSGQILAVDGAWGVW